MYKKLRAYFRGLVALIMLEISHATLGIQRSARRSKEFKVKASSRLLRLTLLAWFALLILPVWYGLEWIWLALLTIFCVAIVTFCVVGGRATILLEAGKSQGGFRNGLIQISLFIGVVSFAVLAPIVLIDFGSIYAWIVWTPWFVTSSFMGGLIGSLVGTYPNSTH